MNAVAGLMVARGWMSVCAFVTFILVGRFLQPAEFGVFALATSAALAAHAFVGGGLYEYVLGRDPEGEREATAETCAVLTGVFAFVLDLIFSAIAWFGFHSFEAVVVLLGYGVASLSWGFVVIKEAALIRDGRGGVVATVLWTGETLGIVLLVATLLLGWGVYALVASRLINALTGFAGYMLASKNRFEMRFDRNDASEMTRFSWGLVGGRVVDWANGYGGDLVIGLFLSAAGVGVFRMGARLYLAGAAVLIQAPTPAMIAYLGRANSKGRLRRGGVRALRMQLALATPLFIGVAAIAPTFVGVLLGPQWQVSGGVFSAFCLFAPAAMLSIVLGSMMLASGRTATQLLFQVVMILPMTLAMAAGAIWGPLGVAIAKAGFPLIYAALLMFVVRELGAAGRAAIASVLARIIGAAALMAAWCFAAMNWIGGEPSLVARFGLAAGALVVGAVIFVLALRLFDPKAYRLIFAIVRLVRRRFRVRAPILAAAKG